MTRVFLRRIQQNNYFVKLSSSKWYIKFRNENFFQGRFPVIRNHSG